MASVRVLAFDHEGRPIQFDTWLDDLQLYLLSDSRDSISLFDHTSGAAPAPPATADSATRSQTAQALYDAVVARYSSPATAALGRLLLPNLFPELSAFAIVGDLVTHLHTSSARYCAALQAEFLDKNPPPIAEVDCYLYVLPDPGIEAAALSASDTAALQDAMVTTTTPGGQRVSIYMCTRMGYHLATFTRPPGSSLYTLATVHPQVSASLPPSPAPPCLPCVEGRQRTAPHSSSFPPTTALLQTLHMDVWGPARVSGQCRERYFLLVVDDYMRYTTVFPLCSKGEVPYVLITSIRPVRLQLREQFRTQIEVRRIGLVMELARTSMIHADAPHFLWPFAVRYAAHQLNLWPRVSLPETLPTLRWTGEVGNASVFQVWGSRAFVRDRSADKLSARAVPCVFLGFPPDTPGWQFYHPTSRCVFPSQDVTFDDSVPFYRLFPYRSAPLPPPPLFLAPGPPPVDPLPPQGPAPSNVSQVDPLPGTVPVEIAGAGSGGAAPGGAEHGGEEPEGVEPRGAKSEGAESGGAEPRGTASSGDPSGASPRLSPRPEHLSPLHLREWFAQRTRLRSGSAGARVSTAGDTGGVEVTAGAGGTGGVAAAGPGGARTRGTGAAGSGGVGGAGGGGAGARVLAEPGGAGAGGTRAGGARAGDTGAVGAGSGGTHASGASAGGVGAFDPGAGGAGAGGAVFGGTDAGGTVRLRPFFVPLLQQVLGLPSSTGPPPPLLCPSPDLSQPPLQPASPLPAPSPYTELSGGPTKRRENESRPASPVCVVRTGHRVPRLRPLLVLDTHAMALLPSSFSLRVPLPPPPKSSLPADPDPESDLACAASPTVSHLLATVVSEPSFESTAASALVAELVDFAAACRLDYATALVAESKSASPPSVGDECALCTDVLEDTQEDFECLAAAVPRFASMLLAPEGDPDAPDIPTPRSYAEAITGPYSSQWQAAMDAKMESWKSTGTYIDAVPPSRTNIVDGMWIFRVKRPPGPPPAFKACYVARGFSQQQGVNYFQTFSPTPKMTTLRVFLHVAAQRNYELHTLTAFLQGSLHEEIWLRRPPGFTDRFLQVPSGASGDQPTVLLHFGLQFSSPQPTPLSTGHSLSAPPSDKSVEPSGPYPKLVGCLITSSMGLVLGGRGPVFLTGYADASWGDDLATQRSSKGCTFSLGSCSVSWRFTRSSSVLNSSCEAEIYAGAMAAQELCWLTYLLTDLGEQPRSPPVLYVDNKAMIALCQEHILEHQTKHIALRYFLARELQQRGQLCLAYVATRANTADIFTKALPPGDHQRFSTMLCLVPTFPHLLTV
ncbi:unnamed protein product [Closterium sp. NIES-53]